MVTDLPLGWVCDIWATHTWEWVKILQSSSGGHLHNDTDPELCWHKAMLLRDLLKLGCGDLGK